MADSSARKIYFGVGNQANKPSGVVFILEWGRHDIRYPQNEIDAPVQNRLVAKALVDKGFNVQQKELPVGQGWHTLSSRLPGALASLFKK